MNDPKPNAESPPPLEPAPKTVDEPFQLAPLEEPPNPPPPEPPRPPRFESRDIHPPLAAHGMPGCFKVIFYLFAAFGMLIAAGIIYLLVVCSESRIGG